MGKRILSVLLAIVLLVTMEGAGLFGIEDAGASQQYGQDVQNLMEQLAQEELTGTEDLSEEQPGDEPSQEELPETEDPSEGESGDEPPQEELPETEDPSEGEPGDEPPQEDPTVQYTIYFNLAGGITSEGGTIFSIQVPAGQLPDTSAVIVPVKKGYLFKGWMDGTGAYYNFDQPVTKDIALLAAWNPITYRVQFDLNGGKGQQPPEQIFTYGKEEILPFNMAHKSGYVFYGWKQKGVGIYQEGAYVRNLADQEGAVVKLKAVWRRGNYKVSFNANGGTGTMDEQVFTCGEAKKLSKNKYSRKGYTFIGWNTRKDGKGQSFTENQKVDSLCKEDGEVFELYAMWKGNPYRVIYDGNGAQSGTVKTSKHVYGVESKLNANHFKRKGFTFAGWNTRKDGKGKTYTDQSKVKTLTTKYNGTVTLYAKWKATQYSISYELRGGKLSKSAKNTFNINTKTFSLPYPSRSGYDFDGWYQDKKFKKRVVEIKAGTTGNRKVYAKWVKCNNSPKKNSAKLTACKANGTEKVKVTATVKKRVVSDDGCYYLVYVNPSNKVPYKMVKKLYKKKKLSFNLKMKENTGYVTSMFGIAVKKKGKYKLISRPSFVKNPEKAAKNKSKYKPGKTKKGIQFSNSMEELKSCGAKNTFLNVTVSMVFGNPTVPYEYNGKVYNFNSMDTYRDIVSKCNKLGINMTFQVMLDWYDGQTDMIATRARRAGAAPYYTWNISNNSAREKMEAMFCYLGQIFGRKSCYVSNWVLGNEINNPVGWNYRGSLSKASYFKTYAHVFRALYYAVRSQYSNAHIFICTDNYWNAAVAGGFSTKDTINTFTKSLNKVQKGLKWNLAYHAYSYPLTYTKFWDGYGITNKSDTPYVTMKNLNVMTNYIKKKYGSSVRIILSEQGYSSHWGQANQAAALAGSYYIAACNPMIDAFIIRSYQDHPEEVAQGLSMGILGKEAFTVFQNMDTVQFYRYTKPYLRIIGIKSWKKLIPSYKKSRIYKMYRKN